jgi:hypothetical protein
MMSQFYKPDVKTLTTQDNRSDVRAVLRPTFNELSDARPFGKIEVNDVVRSPRLRRQRSVLGAPALTI